VDLISKLFVYEPSKRLSANEAIRHPCFSDVARFHGEGRNDNEKERGNNNGCASRRGKRDEKESSVPL